MKASALVPPVEGCEPFRLDVTRHVPAGSGCYVIATVQDHILYIGLAKSVKARFCQHLENPIKVEPTSQGRAVKFFWRVSDELEKLERTWLNAHRVAEGVLPILNVNDSPVAY